MSADKPIETQPVKKPRSWPVIRLGQHEIKLPVLLMIILGLVAVGFSFYVLYGKTHPVKKTEQIGEKPRVYQNGDLQAGIQRNAGDSSIRRDYQEKTRRSRNYGSEIAAYVYEEKQKKEEPDENVQEKKEKQKGLGLPSGTKIPAYTSGAIFSFNVEAPVSVVVSKDILKGEEVVVPKNSKFLGTASVLKSLNRINVSFNRLIFPDGRELTVRALALSEDGSSGIKGKVDKQGGKKFLKGMAEAVVGGTSLFTNSLNTGAYSLQDRLRENLSENLLSDARSNLAGERIETSITVEGFTSVEVLLLEGM
ncbi:MAG: hypothetical protein HZC17_09740 [Candidatus Omnitrophica bacterium]|nr:hypothetical protein [Candidatus Omnitrophota bacterium]